MGFSNTDNPNSIATSGDVALNNTSSGQVLAYDSTVGKWRNQTASSGTTNLTATPTATNVAVASSTGTGATIAGATTSNAGVLSAADKTKLDGIEVGAQVNAVTSVASRTGAVVLTKTDVGLGNVDNTSDASKPVSTATTTALGLKADAASAQVIVRYNSSTSSWPARPAGATWGVLFLSTNSATAAAPSDANLAAGDRWLRHPNAS